MSGEGTGYDAARIEVLEGREAVRKRPGMWAGSVGERGLHHLVFEVVGRAVNRSGSVDVTLTSDGGVRVTDEGSRRARVATADTDDPAVEAQLTSLHAGSEPSGRHIAAVGDHIGGLFVVNALSSRLTAEVQRDGVREIQEYERGVAVAPPAAIGAATGSGTTIAFWPDTEIFETTWCSFTVLAERFRQVAFLNRGLRISLTDERPAGEARMVRFRFPEGARDFVATLDAETGSAIDPDVIGFEREEPKMAGTMEVALLWSGSGEERIRGFVNSRATPQGGTHVEGFRDGVAAAITAYGRKRGALVAYFEPYADLLGEGLTAVVSVKLDHPEFLGATRGLLGNPEVRGCVGEAVRDHLGTWFEDHPERAAEIVDRIVRVIHQD
ncbi:DNA gyrase subunit B [Streptomyces sp. NBC_00287]|uniref:DNA gyrase subunit B n=1 Tax=Streptomyces sp. NBC_00287 TaxID=2975702 RepID=UPI002E28A0AD|nr:DNA gyrase subunit B [Streptomyces sp. NBC_00287]